MFHVALWLLIASAPVQNVLMWAEWPNIAAMGDYSDLACYYKRLANVIIASHAPNSSLRYDRLVLRVEDPLTGSFSPTRMNNWIFDPAQAGGSTSSGEANPFALLLTSLRRQLGSAIDIFVLPSLHVGDYYRWPCYPPSEEACNDAISNGFIFNDEVIPCGPALHTPTRAPTVPPMPTGCTAPLRRNGCPCAHSWVCASNWCAKGACVAKPGVGSIRSSATAPKSDVCTISSAVVGDPYPFAWCCGSVRTLLGNVTIPLTNVPCCDAVINSTLCNPAEIAAKGGVFPCVNPLNRFAFWMKRWEDLLAAEWGLRGGGDAVNGGVVFFDGVAYDLESTGFDERTLHDAMRHYLGPDGYDLTRFDGAPLLIGCTTGISIPSANSKVESFDFWVVETYNMFSAQMRRLQPQEGGGGGTEWSCEAFLVDSLPATNAGKCGRDCKSAPCDTVVPNCSTSIYELHRKVIASLLCMHLTTLLPSLSTCVGSTLIVFS